MLGVVGGEVPVRVMQSRKLDHRVAPLSQLPKNRFPFSQLPRINGRFSEVINHNNELRMSSSKVHNLSEVSWPRIRDVQRDVDFSKKCSGSIYLGQAVKIRPRIIVNELANTTKGGLLLPRREESLSFSRIV
jgi:hypothetical protein